jgi:hypothetical protein
MKEQYNFSVCAGTSNEDILALRAELEKFITAPDNKRDFIPEIDIELLSLGDMKQLDLRIEIKHKVCRPVEYQMKPAANVASQSNFSNETVRQVRRNKFMTALLAAMRAVPIDPPGGGGPALGDPKNPTYSVSVSDLEASGFRAAHHTEKEDKRMFPVGSRIADFLPEGISSAFEAAKPVDFGIQAVTGRRGSSTQGPAGRVSGESMRISRVATGFLQPVKEQ